MFSSILAYVYFGNFFHYRKFNIVSYLSHVESKHNQTVTVECPVGCCSGLEVQSLEQLWAHTVRTAGAVKYVCPICLHECYFLNSHQLAKHINVRYQPMLFLEGSRLACSAALGNEQTMLIFWKLSFFFGRKLPAFFQNQAIYNFTRVALPEMKPCILTKTNMDPEVTEISYKVPSVRRSELSLRP